MEKSDKKYGRMIAVSGFAWAACYMFSLLVVKEFAPPKALGVGLAILPALGFAWFLFNFIRGVARMDELERRIQLEATAVAFCLCLLMLMVLGLLGLVVTLNPEDWSHRHLVPYFFVFYFAGLFFARRRYS